MESENKELLRRFYAEVFADWNQELINELVAPEFRSHDWSVDSRTGPDGFRDFYNPVLGCFPDTHYEVEDIIAEGDKVVVRWKLLGTHEGEFRGIAPTGRSISMNGIAIYRVEGGKLRERWVVYDLFGLISQLQTTESG